MRKFTMLDEAFVCMNCNKEVERLAYTARDHCPYCLYSIHIDNNPGDRACVCKGVLKPIGIKNYKDTYKIVYRCEKCGQNKNNIMAEDDDKQLIIKLSANPVY